MKHLFKLLSFLFFFYSFQAITAQQETNITDKAKEESATEAEDVAKEKAPNEAIIEYAEANKKKGCKKSCDKPCCASKGKKECSKDKKQCTKTADGSEKKQCKKKCTKKCTKKEEGVS